MGSDDEAADIAADIMQISIHAPRVGSDGQKSKPR
ncbi:hypothetical protein BACCAP_00018 [Pseudoflavonifractor capillosus ATCC 29799]|uniref:Uncharacterized protein n=1 Tax=Pseudoflavonifractor capillosus ATCC 29799 TaxID=411467 RepID=A6NP86_9FIRM|nr:hypothetical protein BACCAP_00018 [Pseudoflavonifractor capillosus ATCC 29799]